MAFATAKKLLWGCSLLVLLAGIGHLWMPGTIQEFFLFAFGKYYIINNLHLTIFLCFLNLVLGSGYFLFSRQTVYTHNTLTAVHVVLTLLCSVAIWAMGFILNKGLFSDRVLPSQALLITLGILITAQVLYFINLIRGLSR
ncbi:MAG: hypothetical protein EOO01_33110 [Chitinophagaceae bacterium]|nr:MAG: hypothetical protein EOO01_33110 [Chitinophagaceae bacterium]